MLSLTERPEPWSFSRNYIRYRFQAGNLGTQSILIQVRLYVGDVAGNTANDVLVKSYELVPGATGVAEVYVEDLVDAHLQWQLPQPAAGTVTPVSTHTLSYFVEYREVTTLNATPQWVSDAAARRYAIKGGLPQQLFNRSLPAQLSQFSYQQGFVARVGIGDFFHRTFVNLAGQQPSGRNAQISLLYSDNTTQTGTLALGVNHYLYHVPASPAAWGLVLATGKVPVSYRVQVVETDSTGTVLSTTVLQQAEIDHNWYRQVQTLHYHNSLGGLDFVRLLGDTDIELERTATDGEAIGTADYNQAAKPGSYFQRNISLQKTNNGDVGYLESPAEQDVLEELDLSESVWALRPLSATVQQWQQIRILNKNRKPRTVGAAGSKRWNWEVQWQWAYPVTAYSSLPHTGLGVDTNNYSITAPVCGLVTNLQVQTYLDPNGFTYASWTWSSGANNWYYSLQYREVGTTTWLWALSTYTTNTIMPVDPGHTYEWRVRAICSLTDTSGWVMGQNFTT